MQLQAFLFKRVKIRGPLGVFEETRVSPTGSGDLSHAGRRYPADEAGWVEVPYDQAIELKKMVFHREDGGYIKYCTPDEIDENLRLGLTDQNSIRPPVVRTEPEPVAKAKSDEPVRRRGAAAKGAESEPPEIADSGARVEDSDLAAAGVGA